MGGPVPGPRAQDEAVRVLAPPVLPDLPERPDWRFASSTSSARTTWCGAPTSRTRTASGPTARESIAREVAPEWTPPSSARCSGRTPPPLRPSPGTRGLRTGPRPRPPTVPHTLRRDERDRPAGRSRPALAIPAAMHDREPPTDSHAPERARVRVQPLPERLRPGANRHAVPRLMQREISARITGYARLHDEGQLRRDEHREQGTPQFKLRLSVIQGAMEPMRAACSRAFRLQSLLVRAHPMD